MKNKFVFAALIGADILLTNMHQFWANADVAKEWHIWDITQAGRICLWYAVSMFIKIESRWLDMVRVNYFSFLILDWVQTVNNTNKGLQPEEMMAFIVVNILMYGTWKKL